MAKIEFSKPLKELLEGSDLQAPIRGLADRVGEILADNKLPFFPDYTDHGIDHINCVLKSEVELVPKPIWENSKKDSDPRLLCDADAAVIIGGTLLHDIAMHLRPNGLRELVSKDTRFQPLPWFKEDHEGHSSDRPWQELWEDYIREARRFSDRQLTNIIGEQSSLVWKFHNLPDDPGQWERNHCLIIGEFIRRHHARLAHEIAIYGFPGLPVGSGESQFPAMGKEEGHPLMRLADLIGLTARSHGTSLRGCKAYLDASPHYIGTPRPMGSAVLYPMALLRVADYLQIDRQRAPAVLLQLRNPPSPISVQEWKKHCAVQHIGPANDPRGKMVTVSNELSLSLYLQVRDLLSGLQTEMDHSTAVLDEAYGTLTELGLHQLNIATRRVYSNLQSPAFRDSLPYVPDWTGFTADPNLLTLLVEPLYGKEPGVGVRELMQNAVDAVCELDAWCAAHGKTMESLDLPDQDGDVLVEFIRRENGSWFLRVQDRGIGMSSDTIQNYYLRAGASFRRSAEWAKEFLDEKGQPRVVRAGRFGIGAFAIFLLGPAFRLRTRHADADKSLGYMIEASANSQLIEVRRVDDLAIGTTIEVEMSKEAVEDLELEEEEYNDWTGPQGKVDWFCWDWPKVVQRVKRGKKSKMLEQEFSWSIRKGKLPPEWSIIHPDGFDAVYWTFEKSPSLICNGIRIARAHSGIWDAGYRWLGNEMQLKSPNLSIVDSGANLPLTTQRYELSQESVPFINDLSRDVALSFIAYALVCGPTSRSESLSAKRVHPLGLKQFAEFGDNTSGLKDSVKSPFAFGRLRWCSTPTSMIPADPWLYTLLKAELCFVYGAFELGGNELLDKPEVWGAVSRALEPTGCSLLHWHSFVRHHGSNREEREGKAAGLPAQILTVLATEGIAALGHRVNASQVLVSTINEQLFTGKRRGWLKGFRHHEEQEPGIWRRSVGDSGKEIFQAQTGVLTPAISLKTVLETIKNAVEAGRDKSDIWREGQLRNPDVFFVAEIKTSNIRRSPESVIARVWNECLGERTIPFNAADRKDMIADGCKHPELKRHIEAWQKMKRRASKKAEEH
ncbi:MAG: ATP-binding protein [Verrucomicrobiia bacterium]